MKRCWFGLGLLIILLVGSLLVTVYMDRTHAPLAQTVEQAGQKALEGDWGNANALAGKARASWEEHWNVGAVFADHDPMEDINGLFQQLQAYAQARDSMGFASVCGLLKSQLEAMADAHSFVWWNLL